MVWKHYVYFHARFTNQPKKYRLVQTDNQPQEVLRVNFNMESSIPSKLPDNLQLLVKEMVGTVCLFLADFIFKL